MSLGVFARAAERGLAKLGEPSSLDGTPCGNVALERGVQVFAGLLDQANDNTVAQHDVATVLSTFNPKVGGVLVHPDGTFKLDRKLSDNGYSMRFVVVAG